MARVQRFFAPVLLFGVASYVAWVNATRSDLRIVFPLLDRVTPDPQTQGLLTVGILATLGTLALLLAFRQRES